MTEKDKKIEKTIKEIEKSLPFVPVDIHGILGTPAAYYLIIGERSNGKSYGALQEGLLRYYKTGKPFAYIRRWDEDLKPKYGDRLFLALENNGLIHLFTSGEWTNVIYKNRKYYFCRTNDKDELEIAKEPFCYCFAVSQVEHSKSATLPAIDYIIFDEFIPMNPRAYIDAEKEPQLFRHLLSTIVRQRDNITILMLANTIDLHSIYFQDMGLKKVKDMKSGQIDVYTYPDPRLKVLVALTSGTSGGKPSDYLFAFDNPEAQMITGGEVWEMSFFNPLPKEFKYKPKDILFSYFVDFDNETAMCDVVSVNDSLFIYAHAKTTPLRKPDEDIIFSLKADPRPNWFRSFSECHLKSGAIIRSLIAGNKIFYSNNSIGDLLENFLARSEK